MAAILEVWIAKPGSPCYVDDHEWWVSLYDAHGKVYQYRGKTYGEMHAPQAHWAATIPPGCYVVQARGKDANGQEIQTDHAIVEAGCEGVVCVRLYVSVPGETKPGDCELTITDVTGMGTPQPASIQVSGTAVNCNQVEVGVSCHDGITGKAIVSVPANGKWVANVNARDLRCQCGGEVVVHAWCTADPKCMSTFKSKLICKKSNSE